MEQFQERFKMRENLPPIIQDWIANMTNKNSKEDIRFNYFTMLSNVRNEVAKETAKFELEYNSKVKKMSAHR